MKSVYKLETGQYSIHNYLIQRCVAGDRQAQNELYKLYAKAMYHVCMRIMGDEDDARDALQEAFISAFNKLASLQETHLFPAWLKRIVVNQCLNTLRKRKDYVEELKENYDVAEQEEDDRTDYFSVAKEKIIGAIEQLPNGARTVLNLYLFEGYDHSEIATILDITVSASKAQYSKAKAKIRALLEL